MPARWLTLFGCALLFLLAFPACSVEQAAMRDRIKQQQFIYDRWNAENRGNRPFASKRALNSYIDSLTAAWSDSAAAQAWPRGGNPPLAFKRLSSYTYMLLANAAKPEWANCHVWSEYMIPALLADYRTARANPSAQTAYLFQVQGAYWTLERITQCNLSRKKWRKLRAAQQKLPGILDGLADAPGTASKIQGRVHEEAKAIRSLDELYGIQNAIYKGNLGQARHRLRNALGDGKADPKLLASSVRDLAYRYRSKGKKDSALAVLDAFAPHRAAAEVSQDSLQNWYATVDAEHRTERLNASQEEAASDRAVLTSSGKEAPALSGEYMNLQTGKPMDLASLRGKTVFVDFWTTWCGPCLAEIPRLNKLAQQQEGREDFAFVSILADGTDTGMSRKEARAFIKQRGVSYRVLYDREERPLIERFGVTGYPAKFVIGENGKLMKPTAEGADLSAELVSAYLRRQ